MERPGELVGKRELVAVVWPDTIVVEANLKVQVAALRRLVAGMTATVQLDPQPEPSAR